MKRIIVSVLAIALTCRAVQAQEIPEHEDEVFNADGHKKHHGNTMANLNLSEEQKSKFKTLNSEIIVNK